MKIPQNLIPIIISVVFLILIVDILIGEQTIKISVSPYEGREHFILSFSLFSLLIVLGVSLATFYLTSKELKKSVINSIINSFIYSFLLILSLSLTLNRMSEFCNAYVFYPSFIFLIPLIVSPIISYCVIKPKTNQLPIWLAMISTISTFLILLLAVNL